MKLLLLLLLTQTSLADTTLLNKGDQAPFKGYLITEEAATKAYHLGLELESKKRIVTLMETENNLLNQRLTLYKDQSKELADQLVSANSTSMWVKTGYFVLGAVLTGLVAVGVSKTIR
jgi:hypothetical protein